MTKFKMSRRAFAHALLAFPMLAQAQLVGNAGRVIVGGVKIKRVNHIGVLHVESGLADFTPIDFRPHDIVPDPRRGGCCWVIERRPGKRIIYFDALDGEVKSHGVAFDHHFLSGHAVFSEGRLLVVENDMATQTGVISVRDPETLMPLDAFSTKGGAPHELIVDKVRNILYVANGGVQNIPPKDGFFPVQGERAVMRSSIAGFGLDGSYIDEWILEDRFLSMRHLALDLDGVLGVGVQPAHAREDERFKAPCLAVLSNGKLALARETCALGGYSGDVVASPDHSHGGFIVSATRSNKLVWAKRSGEVEFVDINGFCAVAVDHGDVFAMTDSNRWFYKWGGVAPLQAGVEFEWDNHAQFLGNRG